MPEKEPGGPEKINGGEKPDDLSDAEIKTLLDRSETDRPQENGPEESAEKDRAEVLELTVKEALQTYRESLAADGDPETAKSKAVRKIYELTTGEYDNLIPETIDKLTAELEKESVTRAEESPEAKPEAASQEVAAGERAADASIPPQDAVREPAGPQPETRPRTERETSQEEKDAIVQTTLGAFKQELKTASINAAEEAARGKLKEAAGNLDAQTYSDLLQKVTQEINALEAEERKKMKAPPSPEAAAAQPETAPTSDVGAEPEKIPEIPLEAPKAEAPAGLPVEPASAEATAGKPTLPRSEVGTPPTPEAPTPQPEQVETPTPPPTEIRTETAPPADEAEKLPPSELTAEEQEAVFAVAKAERIENLPRIVQEKLKQGLNEATFWAEGNKNKFFAGTLEKILTIREQTGADKQSKAQETLGRFIKSLAEIYRRDQQKAQERYEAVKQGGKQTAANIFSLGGNLLRYGRLALDISGYSVVAPLKFVTLGSMAFSRGAEAAKEARFKNEKVIEKTRADESRAEDEAWKIYEAAQMKAGNTEVTSAELNRAFRENLPRDISERLDRRSSTEKITSAADIARNLTERWINFSLERVQKKLDQAETEAEKQKILKKYEGRLNDFNRLVGDYGQIDALAMGAKISEGLAKGVRQAMTVETLFELPFAAEKIWSDLAGALGEKVPEESFIKGFGEKAGELDEIAKQMAIRGLGINLDDGLTENEAQKIAAYTLEPRAPDKQKMITDVVTKIFGSMETSDTGRTVAEIIGERQDKLVDLYDRTLGINSRDGLNTDEAAKITKFMAMNQDDTEELGQLYKVYGEMKLGDGRTVEDLIEKAAPEAVTPSPETAAEPTPAPKPEAAPKAELPPEPTPAPQESPAEPMAESTPAPSPIEKPATSAEPPVVSEVEPKPVEFQLGSKIEIKPTHFENTIEPGGDSIWKSAREIFAKNAREFGYTEDKGDLNKWAETQTANAVKELADREYGGQIKDLVHAGDKVTIEIGGDGRPRLKFENLSGIEPSYLPEKPAAPAPEAIEEQAAPTVSETKPESPAAFDAAGKEATEKLAREYEALPAGDPKRDELVYNYIAGELKKSEYQKLKLPRINEEKLIAFARMFGGGDWAGINSPEKLAQTLTEFDTGLKFYTGKLVDGSLDRIFKEGGEKALELTHNVFPVETRDGEILYVQMDKSGKWRVADSNGDPVELKRPIMGKTSLFGLKKVKNLLGYKSLENMPELPAEPKIETPTPLSEPEQAAPPREAAGKEAAIQKGAAPELAEKQNQEIPVDIAIGNGSFQGKVEVTPDGAVRFEGTATMIEPSKVLREDWRKIVIEEIGGKRDLNFGMRDIEMGARNVMIQQEVAKAIAAEKPAEAAALRNAAQRQIEQLEKIYGDIFK